MTAREMFEELGYKRRARLLHLNGNEMCFSINWTTGYYIGKIGNIIDVERRLIRNGVVKALFDVEFEDGARFCVDREQIEFVKENSR